MHIDQTNMLNDSEYEILKNRKPFGNLIPLCGLHSPIILIGPDCT